MSARQLAVLIAMLLIAILAAPAGSRSVPRSRRRASDRRPRRMSPTACSGSARPSSACLSTGAYTPSPAARKENEGPRRMADAGAPRETAPRPQYRQPFNPNAVGGSRQASGHEVPRDNQQAPRRFLPCSTRRSPTGSIMSTPPTQAHPDERRRRRQKKGRSRSASIISIMDWHHPDYVPRRAWRRRGQEGADSTATCSS